jgi:hypothetical protein
LSKDAQGQAGGLETRTFGYRNRWRRRRSLHRLNEHWTIGRIDMRRASPDGDQYDEDSVYLERILKHVTLGMETVRPEEQMRLIEGSWTDMATFWLSRDVTSADDQLLSSRHHPYFAVLPVDSILCEGGGTMNRKDGGSSSNNYRVALSTLAKGPLASKSSSAPRARTPIWSFRPLTSAGGRTDVPEWWSRSSTAWGRRNRGGCVMV